MPKIKHSKNNNEKIFKKEIDLKEHRRDNIVRILFCHHKHSNTKNILLINIHL